jgi:hypothetical protein
MIVCLSLRRAAVGSVLSAAALVLASHSGLGADPTVGQDSKFFSSGLSAPESPASGIIGANTSNIVRPGTVPAYGAALLNGFDINGNFKTGLGVAVSPYQILGTTTFDQYQNDAFERILARTEFSLATAKGATDQDKSVQIGFGLRTVMFDAGDLALDSDLSHCGRQAALDAGDLVDKMNPIPKDVKEAAQPSPGIDVRNLLYTSGIAKCTKSISQFLWNRSAWEIYGGNALVATNGSYNSVKQQTYQIGTSFSYGFDNFEHIGRSAMTGKDVNWFTKNAQLVVGTYYTNGQIVPDSKNKGAFFVQNALVIGSQFRFRIKSLPISAAPTDDADFSFNNTLIAFTANFTSASPVGKAHADSATISAAFEFKLSDSMYLDVGAGFQTAQGNRDLSKFVSTQIKYNIASVASLFR